MIGVLVNTAAVIVGSLVGLLFKKGIPEKLTQAVMVGIGLCTVYIGVSGTLKGENTLILILSMVIGAIVGTGLDLDGYLNALGKRLGARLEASPGKTSSVMEGFVTSSLLFCVGAMAIVGSLNAGLTGDNSMLFTKSLLDLVTSAMLSVSLGIGVLFAAACVFVYQGAIVLLAQVLQGVLTDAAIAEITCAGSLLILALGLNLLGAAKIKVANYLPAILVAPVCCWVLTLF